MFVSRTQSKRDDDESAERASKLLERRENDGSGHHPGVSAVCVSASIKLISCELLPGTFLFLAHVLRIIYSCECTKVWVRFFRP